MTTAPTRPGAPAPTRPVGATVNGQLQRLDAPAQTTALDWLRSRGLTGAKEGCAEGECGACSILVARPDATGGTRWTAVNACLVPAAALDGQEVLTSEGLGTPQELHPVQYEMAVRGGSQCGYCTPGFVCSTAAEYYRPGRGAQCGDAAGPAVPNEPAADGTRDGTRHGEVGENGFDLHALSGNLCRCTGYRPIRDAAYALGLPEPDDVLAQRRTAPPPPARSTRYATDTGTYARATTLVEATQLIAEHPDAVVVAGSTDWGVEVNLRGARAPFVVGIDRVPELRELRVDADQIEIGAALSLSEIEDGLAGRIPVLDQLFPQFASRLIRNAATIGGNLGTGSPIGDTPPVLLALEAGVVLASAGGEREVPIAEYFTGYRQSVRRPDELIRSVRIPLPLSPVSAFHKIAKRRFDDISSVAVGFALTVEDGLVTKARIGLGGVAATPIRATATETALEGQPFSREHVRAAAAVMSTEGTPMDDHRASAAYRAAMLGTALMRLQAEHTSREEASA